MAKKLKVTRTIELRYETYSEAYDGMTLQQAIQHEKELGHGEVIEILEFGDNDVEFTVNVEVVDSDS